MTPGIRHHDSRFAQNRFAQNRSAPHRAAQQSADQPQARRAAGRGIRRLVAAALAAGLTLSLSACSNADPLAEQQYGDSADKGYISGTGAVKEFAADQRPSPVTFSGTTEDGRQVTQDDLSGKVSVVNFWYAACPPCRAEAGDLKTLHSEFESQGVEFLGVNVRDGGETAQAFERNYGIDYPSVLDAEAAGGTVQAAFAAAGVPPKAVPTTVVIGRDGRVTATILGQLDAGTLRALIKTAVAE